MWLPLIILLFVLVPAIIYIVVMEMQLLLITIFLLGAVFLFTQLADTFFGGSELLAILAILITAIPIFLLYRRWGKGD